MAASATPQDILINNDGDALNCKVVSTTTTEVVFSVPKSEILMIQYADGKKQTFSMEEVKSVADVSNNITPAKVETIAPLKATGVDTIEIRKKDFYLNGVKIKEKEVREIISKSNCETALKTLKSRKGNKAFNLIGAAFLGGGVGVVAVTFSDFDSDSTPVIIGGAAAAFGLTAMLISSSAMSKKLRLAARQYNSCLQK